MIIVLSLLERREAEDGIIFREPFWSLTRQQQTSALM